MRGSNGEAFSPRLALAGRRRRWPAACRMSRSRRRPTCCRPNGASRRRRPRRRSAIGLPGDALARQSRRRLRLARARGADRAGRRGEQRRRRGERAHPPGPGPARHRARGDAARGHRLRPGISGTRTERTISDPFDFTDAFGGVDISFDLDLFGAGRAERRAARQRLRAAEFDRDATLLVVQSDVARAYVQRAALAARIDLLDRNIVQAQRARADHRPPLPRRRSDPGRSRPADDRRARAADRAAAPRRGARPHPHRAGGADRRGGAALRAGAGADRRPRSRRRWRRSSPPSWSPAAPTSAPPKRASWPRAATSTAPAPLSFPG